MRSAYGALVLVLACLAVAAYAEDTPAAETPKPVNDGFTDEQRAAMEQGAEKHEFQAEVHRLMDILINSLYGNREIFLRELISNAADACDKIRFESLTDKAKLGEGDSAELDIRIQFDKDSRTITLTDKGIGMTKAGLIKYLGVVASTGTTEFLDKMKAGSGENSALSLIGQFGVGFYSVYLVADKVTVVSKHNDDEQHIWQSKADRTFTVVKDPRGNTLGRGTSITLELKEDASEFLNEETLKKIVTKYSEFINFPIYLLTHREEEKEVPDEEAQKAADEAKAAKEAAAAEGKKDEEAGAEKKEDGEKKEGDEDLEVSEEDGAAKKDEDDGKPKMKKVKESIAEWKQINNVKAIWTRDSSEITDDEYNGFYKTLTKDEKGKLNHIHFKAEGEISFKSILYIPKKAPDGYYDRFYEKSNALKLYVRRVLISEEFDDFMPRYLSFVKGVVDSDDLPLNVNREALAENRVLKVMGKKLTRKALDMLKKMADRSAKLQTKFEEEEKEKADKKDDDDKEKAEKTEDEKKEEEEEKREREMYDTFYKEFGKSIKLGVIDDRANKAALAKLLRYQSTKSGDRTVSLAAYVSNMPEKQNVIYYITGANIDSVKDSPMLEKLKKRGFEVLFMVDPLDEYVVQQLPEFDGKKLQSVTKDAPLDSKDKSKQEKLEDEHKDVIKWLKDTFGSKVEKVTVSTKLTSSPCAVTTGQYGYTANMERIMKAQTFADGAGREHMIAKKTLEINPRHPIIKEIAARAAKDPADKALADLANMMLDSALLVSGFVLDNPTDLSARLNRVLASGLAVDPEAAAEDEPEEVEEAPAAEEAADAAAAEGGEAAAGGEDAAAAAEDLAKNLAGEKDEL